MTPRGALLTLTAALALATGSCGGGRDPIRIGLLADCEGFVAAFYDVTLAGAELPLLRRGAEQAGRRPTDGVTGVEIGGHPLELSFACAAEATKGTIEVRRLVEGEGVDLLVGPNILPTGAVIVDYARRRPEVTFVVPSWGEALAHLDPGPNVFSLAPTNAQLNAGLGFYAYEELGWRRARTIAHADAPSWGYQAAFVAEFCSLGGEIVDRVWLDTLPEDTPARLAEVPTDGVDGFFIALDAYSAGLFLERFANTGGDLAREVVAGGDSLALDPAVAARLGGRLVGLVKADGLPFDSPSPAFTAYTAEFERAFPELAGTASAGGHTFDIAFERAMEAVLRALEDVDGDLSDGQRSFRAALARVELDSPTGRVHLDEHRRAIVPVYLHEVEKNEKGALSFRPLRTIKNVDASFGGRFDPGAPPSRTEPPCERGNVPPWASGSSR
jgi:branched-chain amino acid transport system substrate-binding protein